MGPRKLGTSNGLQDRSPNASPCVTRTEADGPASHGRPRVCETVGTSGRTHAGYAPEVCGRNVRDRHRETRNTGRADKLDSYGCRRRDSNPHSRRIGKRFLSWLTVVPSCIVPCRCVRGQIEAKEQRPRVSAAALWAHPRAEPHRSPRHVQTPSAAFPSGWAVRHVRAASPPPVCLARP